MPDHLRLNSSAQTGFVSPLAAQSFTVIIEIHLVKILCRGGRNIKLKKLVVFKINT